MKVLCLIAGEDTSNQHMMHMTTTCDACSSLKAEQMGSHVHSVESGDSAVHADAWFAVKGPMQLDRYSGVHMCWHTAKLHTCGSEVIAASSHGFL